jgi:hypothetical protein
MQRNALKKRRPPLFKTAKARLSLLMLLAFLIVPARKAHAQPTALTSETTVSTDTDSESTAAVAQTDDDDDDDGCCVITGSSPEPPC